MHRLPDNWDNSLDNWFIQLQMRRFWDNGTNNWIIQLQIIRFWIAGTNICLKDFKLEGLGNTVTVEQFRGGSDKKGPLSIFSWGPKGILLSIFEAKKGKHWSKREGLQWTCPVEKGFLFNSFPIHKGLNKKTLERENKLPREKYICLDWSDQHIEMNEDRAIWNLQEIYKSWKSCHCFGLRNQFESDGPAINE